MKSGEIYRGSMVECEDNWNCQLESITYTAKPSPMSDLLPPRSSPLHCIGSVYDKAMQRLNAVFRNIRFPFLWGWMPTGEILGVDEVYWGVLSSVPLGAMVFAVENIPDDPGFFNTVLFVTLLLLHFVALFNACYWYRDMPCRLIGANAKFMLEVIPLVGAVALRYIFLEFHEGYLGLLLVFPTYIYVFAHFMHLAYDIREKDFLVGSGMHVLVYMLEVELFVRALVFSLCLGVCFYRYMTYCAPQVPDHPKKEVEQLPC